LAHPAAESPHAEENSIMINPNKIEEMARSIQAALPPGLKSVGEEVDKKVKQVLQAQLMKLDLVSREEFDVQTKVLLRTREKLQAMEEKLQQLEQQLTARD
jgi:BMFP domain-containing protein YqiC